METIFIILLVLFNIWTIYFYTKYYVPREEVLDIKDEKTPIDPMELVGKSLFKVSDKKKQDDEVQHQKADTSEAVSENDVTFEDEKEQRASAQIADEDLDEAFEDVRVKDIPMEYKDEDSEEIPPQATGTPFEDIDLAVRTVKKKTSTQEEKVKAGNVFHEMEGNELFEKLINNTELVEQINESIDLAMREMEEKKEASSKEERLELPDRYEDFNFLDFV